MNETQLPTPTPTLFDDSPEISSDSSLSLDAATDIAIRSQFAPEIIGKLLLKLSEADDGMELAIGFAAVVAKAKRVRIRAQKAKG